MPIGKNDTFKEEREENVMARYVRVRSHRRAHRLVRGHLRRVS